MNTNSGGASFIASRFFYGAAALAAVTFIVAAIIDGYEAEIAAREAEYFTSHGTVFFVIAAVSIVAGFIFSMRVRKQQADELTE